MFESLFDKVAGLQGVYEEASGMKRVNLKPSKHLLVLKKSSTRLQRNKFTSSKTSSRHLAKTS